MIQASHAGYLCPECPLKFATPDLLRPHLETHRSEVDVLEGGKTQDLCPKGCGRRINRNAVRAHAEVCQGIPKPISNTEERPMPEEKCPHCEEGPFKRLKSHINKTHPEKAEKKTGKPRSPRRPGPRSPKPGPGGVKYATSSTAMAFVEQLRDKAKKHRAYAEELEELAERSMSLL